MRNSKSTPTADTRTALIRRASIIALVGNAILALVKVAAGLLFSSLSVLGDGIDSSTDVAIALMSLFVAGIIARPADREHPWGHARAETVATTALAFILFFAGAQLFLQAIGKLMEPTAASLPSLVPLLATILSIVGKLAIAATQYSYGRRADSAMLRANALNMRNDVIMSSGVLVGLVVSILFKFPQADAIVALLVSLWVIRSAWGVFREVNVELMDGTEDNGHYMALFQAVRSVPGVLNPHRARMRKLAGAWDIDLDIEVDGRLSVRKAHEIACAVERAIRAQVEGVYDIMVHVEPAGCADTHDEEQYGLSERELDKTEGK